MYFDLDGYAVPQRYRRVLEAHATYARTLAAQPIRIEGHADERGSREYNLALGQRRAEEVAKVLALGGADPARIEAISFGKERPRALCREESCWQENRRADIAYPIR